MQTGGISKNIQYISCAECVYKYDSVMTNLLKIFRKPIRLNEIITDLNPFQQEYLITSIRKGLLIMY